MSNHLTGPPEYLPHTIRFMAHAQSLSIYLSWEGLEIRYTLHNLALVNKAGVSYRFCYLENSKYIHLFGGLNRRFHVINLTLKI